MAQAVLPVQMLFQALQTQAVAQVVHAGQEAQDIVEQLVVQV